MDIQLKETKERETRPKYFDVTKNDVLAPHPTWPTPSSDPFPDKQNSDIVRKIKIGEEVWLFAEISGPDAGKVNIGDVFARDWLQFRVESIEETFGDERKIYVEASATPTPLIEPARAVEEYRRLLAS